MDITSRYINAVSAIAEAVSESFDLDRILQIGLKIVLKFEGLKAGTIRLVDLKSGMLVLKAYDGFPPRAIRKLKRIKPGEKFSGLAAMTGKPVVITDISNTPWLAEIAEVRPELKSLASVPLRSKDNIIGALNVYSENSDYFSQRVMQLLKAVGLQIGIAVENGKLVEKYQQNLNWFEHLVRTSPFGIMTCDIDGKIQSLNSAAEKILGVSLENVKEKIVTDAFSDQKAFLSAVSKESTRQAFSFYRKDRGWIFVNLTGSPITNESKQEIGSILILEDVTEKKKTEDQIQRISKLISLGQLASGIAHEIRNPLSGITYVLDDIHDFLQGHDERRYLLEKAIKEVDRVDEIVSGLLDFARVSQIEFSSHNVNAVLDDALLWIRNRCNQQGIEVLKDLDPNLPDIMLDPKKLKQAFLDLVINAVDAMQNGGTLKIQTRGHSRAGRNGKEQSKFIEVMIEDTGRGIPALNQHRIFDPFFTTKPEGSGLGLAITHSIILEHGGKITVDSEEQQGARFSIYLPTSFQKRGGILTVGIESDIDVLDPHRHLGWMTYRVVRNIFEGVVCRDLTKEDVAYAPVIPSLAESFEVSSDNCKYSFHLRKGIKFHDNTPLDAAAIRFNIERMTNPEAIQYDKDAAQYSSFIWKYLEKVVTPSDWTVEIHLNEPFSEFLAQLTEGGVGSARILSPSAWEMYGSQGLKNHPIGTGPFRFVERGKRGEIILEKNYDYWGELPFLDKLIFKPMPEPAARIAALQTGEVDLIFVPPPDTVEILTKAGFRVVQGPVPHNWYLSLNMRSPKMRDIRVRKAISMAIDKEKMARDLLKGTAKAAHGLQAPGCPSYDAAFVDHPFDPSEAKRLLAQAGYGNGLTMTFQTSTAGSGQLIPIQMAEWIKNDLARVGIDCKVEFHEWIHYIDLWANGMQEDIDANQISWGMSSDYWLEVVAHSHNHAPRGKNSGYYHNPRVDELLDAARGEYDEEKKVDLYRQVNVGITQDAAYIPIVNDLAPIVMNPKVRGFVHAPSEWYDFNKVWIEEEALSGDRTVCVRNTAT